MIFGRPWLLILRRPFRSWPLWLPRMLLCCFQSSVGSLKWAEAAKSKSKASPRGRRRSDMVVSAASAHAPNEAAE